MTETLRNKNQQEPKIFLNLEEALEMIRTDQGRAKQIFDELGFIQGEDESVRVLLERKFYAAVEAQRDAIMSQDINDQRFANGISHLTYHLGCYNAYLPAREYFTKFWEPKFVSGEELKKLQVEKMRTQLDRIVDADSQYPDDTRAEAALRLAALEQYVACTTINDELAARNQENLVDDDTPLSRKEKLVRLSQKTAAALAFAAMTLGLSATTGHAATENAIDDESNDPDNGTIKKPRRIVAPIKLAEPAGGKVEPPVRVDGNPQSTRTPDGSVKLATPTVIEPPSRIEASPNISTIPNVPNTPPAAPAPAIETAPPASVMSAEKEAAQHLANAEGVNPKGTSWKNTGLVIEYLLDRGFTDSQAIGVAANMMWESVGIVPGMNQDRGPAYGIVQWEGGRRTEMENYAASHGKPVDDLYVQLDFMMMELERDGWNGLAELRQAQDATSAMLIFEEKFERAGKPAIPQRKALVIAITDMYNGKLHAIQAARQAATVGSNNATKINKPELEKKATAHWLSPIENGTINSHYGDRGGVHHDGSDFPAKVGTEFRAVEDGIVIELAMEDVTGKQWCIAALEGIRYYGPLPDPVQKTVMVKHLIGDDVYISRYDHLSEFTVEVGDIVKAGQAVGIVGSSGCSTGRHAHFGMKKNGRSINPALLFQ